jgi:hypothetical protein
MLTDDGKQWGSEVREGDRRRFMEQCEQNRRFMERLSRFEATIVTEFRKFALPFEARQRSHEAARHALQTKCRALSDRVKNLEGRRSTPTA